MDEQREKTKTVTSVIVYIKKGQADKETVRFTDSFSIGRGKENDLQLKDEVVSRIHTKIYFDGEQWWIKDLESRNGTFVNGVRFMNAPLAESAELELGKGGPLLSLKVETEKPVHTEKPLVEPKVILTEEHIMRRLDKSRGEEAGEQTIMFRRVFAHMHKKKSRKYLVVIGAALLLLLVSGGIIIYQQNRLDKMRDAAVEIFYSMKTLELQISQLQEIILSNTDPVQVKEMDRKREQLKELEKNYDEFLKEMRYYNKMPEDEKIILQVARIFGECELNIPQGFVTEVKRYIAMWKSTDRLKNALSRAQMSGYEQKIIDTFNKNNITDHYFYLALQESSFNPNAVGPSTKFGYAKGIWQFIPMTADRYGLKVGPLFEQPVYDPKDERFNFEKATEAAVKYIRDINNTEAQASGLLVMASYNWGETKVRDMIRKMPENSRERNFWRLLATAKIPQETYDYVFSIFSAAVICENPRLFGFNITCPLQGPEKAQAARE
jgi:membrane-bound lytic murein transglycosylase D